MIFNVFLSVLEVAEFFEVLKLTNLVQSNGFDQASKYAIQACFQGSLRTSLTHKQVRRFQENNPKKIKSDFCTNFFFVILR